MRRHPLAQMFLLGVLASIVGTAIVLLMDWFPEQGDTAADDIDTLYDVLLVFSVPIFVLVMTVAIYSVIKFRVKPGDESDGAPIHGNTRLELLWVTVPFLIVTGLAIYGWVVLDDIEAKKPNELVVNVTGQQFAWSFAYPDERVETTEELVLPKDRPVLFRIKTNDVIHSFWVPEFRLKSDAVPGLTTEVRLTPNKVGRWQVVCAELCGIGHSTMRQTVRVVPERQFASWVREQGGGPQNAQVEGAGAPDGRQVFTATGCGACHRLADARADGGVGPPLDDLARAAGRRRPGVSAEQYVRQSIEDPRAFVVRGYPRNVMPDDYRDKLSREERDALVQYLLDVSGGGSR